MIMAYDTDDSFGFEPAWLDKASPPWLGEVEGWVFIKNLIG